MFLALFFGLFLCQCKSDSKVEETPADEPIRTPAPSKKANTSSNKDIMPCEIFFEEMVANSYDLKNKIVDTAQGKLDTDQEKSCIVRWMVPGKMMRGEKVGNYSHTLPGIWVELKVLYGDVREAGWAQGKMEQMTGEGDLQSHDPSKLTVFNVQRDAGIGELAAWNGEASRLYWKNGVNIYELSVYEPVDEKSRLEKALAIGKQIDNNINKK
jgi:hypothetical protein